MEDCLSVAMEKPRVLVKINQIIEFETMRDLDRIELVPTLALLTAASGFEGWYGAG